MLKLFQSLDTKSCTLFIAYFCKMLEWLKKLFTPKEESTPDPMKYLITGLGNMHPDYKGTRHNIGFEVVDLLAEDAGVSWKNDQLGDICEIKHKGRTLILLKPSTYMNRSGKAVKFWMLKHKILADNLLVVLDDKNIDFGHLKLKAKGSDGGHNGLKDIDRALGANKYARLRFGIGDDYRKGRQVDFVLGKWSEKELDEINYIIKRAADGVLDFASIGLKFTMEKVNRKPKKT